jgi:hypothetical protein
VTDPAGGRWPRRSRAAKRVDPVAAGGASADRSGEFRNAADPSDPSVPAENGTKSWLAVAGRAGALTIFGVPASHLALNKQMTLDVIMIGPRGVGKTSVLASLYDQFPSVIGQTNLELRAVGVTRGLLQEYREQLETLARGQRDSGQGISGTMGIVEHTFDLGTKNIKVPQLRLRFTDVNGELIAPESGRAPDPGALERLQAALAVSSVVFVAIDSPALMERGGEFNDRINKPKLVAEFVRDAAQNKPNLLVVLVPLKCEKYREPREMAAVAKAVRDSYGEMVMQLGGLPGTRCGVVMTPVQTVGSMVFSRYENDRALFRLRNPGMGIYSPQDTEQPLRWLLRFAANSYLKQDKSVADVLYRWWTDSGIAFREALTSFTGGTKSGEPGFQILAKHDYLELP